MLKPLKTPRNKNQVIRLFTENFSPIIFCGFLTDILRVNYGQITGGGILRAVTAGISQFFTVNLAV